MHYKYLISNFQNPISSKHYIIRRIKRCQLQYQTVNKYVTHHQTTPDQKCCTHSRRAQDSLRERRLSTICFKFRCDRFYDSRSVSPNRSTTFGFGNKYDFTK